MAGDNNVLIDNVNKLENAVKPFMPKVKEALANSVKNTPSFISEQQ